MAISIRLSDDERQLAESYAKLYSLSLGEMFKRAFFERIEDEYDITLAKEAHEEYVKNNILHSELNNLFNLNNVDWIKIGQDSEKSILLEIFLFKKKMISDSK